MNVLFHLHVIEKGFFLGNIGNNIFMMYLGVYSRIRCLVKLGF